MEGKIDLTWNLFVTLIAIPLVGIIARSWFLDIKKDIAALADAAEKRYENFRKELEGKASVEYNGKEHDEMWDRINRHCHDKEGNVVIPRKA